MYFVEIDVIFFCTYLLHDINNKKNKIYVLFIFKKKNRRMLLEVEHFYIVYRTSCFQFWVIHPTRDLNKRLEQSYFATSEKRKKKASKTNTGDCPWMYSHASYHNLRSLDPRLEALFSNITNPGAVSSS